MSKAEAQRVYKLTDKDFDSLTRVVSSLLQRVFIMRCFSSNLRHEIKVKPRSVGRSK